MRTFQSCRIRRDGNRAGRLGEQGQAADLVDEPARLGRPQPRAQAGAPGHAVDLFELALAEHQIEAALPRQAS